MKPLSPLTLARVLIVLAVCLQAIGKVSYGTWLVALPAPLFVFISFALTATFFLAVARKGVGGRARGALLLLNAGTALTFLCFFQALKLIEPAVAGAVEIGVGPILTVAMSMALTRERPPCRRVVICIGVLSGCVLLGVAALGSGALESAGQDVWLGLAASVAAGFGAALITMASKTLLGHGWTSGAVLAHRFYLILPLSLAMAWGAGGAPVEWSGHLVAVLLAVSVIGILIPLYLLQVGIRYSDPHTVMVTMAALPVVTFLLEGLSPRYAWSWGTAAGLAVVTVFLLLDARARRR